MLMTGISLRTCAACFVGATFASVCSGDRSRERKEAGDAAREGHDKGRSIVDDASDRASSITDGVRDKVLWHDHLTSACSAAIFKGIPLGRMLLMVLCGTITMSALSLGVMVCQLSRALQLVLYILS